MLSLRSSLLWLLVGGGLASVACGDDDGGSDPVSTGGKGGGGGIAGSGGVRTGGAGSGAQGGAKTGGTGGVAPTGGSAPTGGTNGGGGTTTGGGDSGGTTGGTVPTAGAAGSGAGEAGSGGEAGGGAGEAGGGGAAGSGGAGGSGGLDEEGGSGGEAGEAALSPQHLYVGCADASGSLQAYLFNGTSLSPLGTTLTTGAISNATFNDDQDLMYVAHTVTNGETKITTYTRNTASGALTPLGTPADVPSVAPSEEGGAGGAPAGGTQPGPQTLTLDNGEDFLAVPNYSSNNVYVYEVLGNGSVGEIVSDDSDGEKAHHAIFSSNNNFMLVPYLGSDQITVYAFDEETGEIAFQTDEQMAEDDSGPRHLALHPNGTWLYAIHETAGGASSEAGLLDAFTFNQSTGAITFQDSYEVPLPDGYSGLKNGSEIAFSPSGDFLYVSMRLDNAAEGSIVVFEVNTGGTLSFVQEVSSRGVTPRHFSLSRDGQLLVVGNQNSDTVALFRVDTSSGELTFLDDRDVCDSPRFALFADID